jgi:hypothetical protein
MRSRIIGVDFSGAEQAGKAIWVADGEVTPDGLALTSCIPASELPGGAVARAPALAAFVDHLAEAKDAAVGMDYPFSLPQQFVAPQEWVDWTQHFRTTFPTADSFRAEMRRRANNREIKRHTDIEAKTPFCPWNLRLYRQTWHGIAGVLAPLIAADAVCVLPMQEAVAGKTMLLEACPASLLKAEGLHRTYKGRSAAARNQRAVIIKALAQLRLLVSPKGKLLTTLLNNEGGDALDAVLAGLCAMRACADPTNLKPRDEIDRLEARVYF